MSISREQILHTHLVSNERGTAVGLRLKGRPQLLITTIEKILGSNTEAITVVLNTQSIYGEPISTNHLTLSDIEQAFLLRVRFDDPFYECLRNMRSNIRAIRQQAGFEKKYPTVS